VLLWRYIKHFDQLVLLILQRTVVTRKSQLTKEVTIRCDYAPSSQMQEHRVSGYIHRLVMYAEKWGSQVISGALGQLAEPAYMIPVRDVTCWSDPKSVVYKTRI
jgi:hypothetical protein